jgi:hypothetical protein
MCLLLMPLELLLPLPLPLLLLLLLLLLLQPFMMTSRPHSSSIHCQQLQCVK